MGRHPGTGQREESPTHAFRRRGESPNVCHGMCRPTLAAVNRADGLGTVVSQVGNIGKQRSITLGQVADIGQPIVLFRVDIQMIIARPTHVASQVIIEETLQSNGQRRVFTRRSNGQVTTVLEKQGLQAGILVSFAKSLPPAVHRNGFFGIVGQFQ